MKSRFILFRRAGVYYCEDTTTGKQSSLKTKEKAEAMALLHAKNESFRQTQLNVQIARAYLSASDPAMSGRTWQAVMDEMQTHGKPVTQQRCSRAMLSKSFDGLRCKGIVETNVEDFLNILKGGKVSEAHYLRRLHNLALALGWLAVPVLAPRLWPKPQYKPKRGITPDEHQRILAAERNSERSLFYQLLWEVGASQSDAAALSAENLDWSTRTLTYFRMKTGEQAQMAISKRIEAILNHLPTEGPLFPKLSQATTNSRAADFRGLCKRLSIAGVSLHSYRYAWAERAKTCGYPERFAQAALGHILIIINGVVGNNSYRKLDPEEFRGFAMCDAYAPLIFINGADFKAAQMFTFGHELAHIWIGEDGVSNFEAMQPPPDKVERFCNAVAAEFLVPAREMKACWHAAQQADEPYQYLAGRFKVSSLVAARRALDLGLAKALNALASGGKIEVPLAKTFFSTNFGMVVDKFGVFWMVLVTAESAK